MGSVHLSVGGDARCNQNSHHLEVVDDIEKVTCRRCLYMENGVSAKTKEAMRRVQGTSRKRVIYNALVMGG